MALLFFGAGLLTQIPSISAQDAAVEQASQDEAPSEEENPLRIAERSLTLGGDTGSDFTAPGTSVWSVVRMILVLALVAAAVYGIVFFLKKSSKKSVSSDPFLKILASVHLGNNRYAHIVSVGEKAWLLGSSDGGVNLIGEVDDKDTINAMRLEESKKNATVPGKVQDFFGLLRKLGTPVKQRPPSGDIQSRRDRLKGL